MLAKGTGRFLIMASLLTVSLGGLSAAHAKRVLRVATWDSGQGLKVEKDALAAYTRANPDVTFSIESTAWGTYQPKVMTELAAGQPPDVFMIGDVDLGYFVAAGFVEPLDSYIARDRFDLSDMKASLRKQFTFTDGRIYGLPKDYAPLATIYNKDLFGQAGLPEPQPSWTWDQAIEAARKTTKVNDSGRVTTIGLQMNSNALPVHYLLNTFGTSLLGTDGKFAGHLDSAASLGAIELLCSLTGSLHFFDQWGAFELGKVAVTLDGPWGLSTFKSKKGLHYGTQVPPMKSQKGSSFATSAWAVAANSRNKALAWDVVKFLGGPQGHTVMGSNEWALPGWNSVVKALKVDANPDLSAFDAAAEGSISIAPMWAPYYPSIYDKYIQPAITLAFSGKASVPQAMRSVLAPAQRDYDRLVARAAARGRK